MNIDRTTFISLFATLLLVAGVKTAGAGELSMEDAKVVAAYPLSMEMVQRKYAAAADMARLSASDSEFGARMQSLNQMGSLDAQIKAVAAVPKAVAVLQAHGISARDYSLTTLAVNLAQQPQLPASSRPSNLPLTPTEVAAPREHVEFVRAHIDEIHKLTAAIVRAREGQP